ncbi:MAG TPA: cellulase family glycosylhydrolase [Ktedonobacteraceae bacterium]|nr:cellulase family glycosylhydrolase [Ktedonobacteraceae bacterium]
MFPPFFSTRHLKFWGMILTGLVLGSLLLSLMLTPSILAKRNAETFTAQNMPNATRTSVVGPTPEPSATHPSPQPSATPLSPQPTVLPQVAYHTSGKRILDTIGRPYVPYGVFLGGILLANQNWQQNGARTYITRDAIQAAHDFWSSNMISLQVAYEPLFPQGASGPLDGEYLAFIDKVVKQANALGMNVSIVLQEEAIYGTQGQKVTLPTVDALTFWDIISRHYARNQRVFFDLFNEPDISGLTEPAGETANDCTPGSGSQAITWDDACAWSYWKNGTTQGGVTYYGMNQLAHKIRANGAQNLIFAQGLATGEDLALLANTYTAQQGREFRLTVPNVVYAVHPYFGLSHDTQNQWDQWFGQAAALGDFPVLAAEWSLNQEKGSGCEASSQVQIPQISVFLRYLRSKSIGLVGWALQSGALIRNWNFRNPTTFSSATMPTDCDVPPLSTDPQAQGAGKLLQEYFAANSIQT